MSHTIKIKNTNTNSKYNLNKHVKYTLKTNKQNILNFFDTIGVLTSHFIPYEPYAKIKKIYNYYKLGKYVVKELIIINKYKNLLSEENIDNMILLMDIFKNESNKTILKEINIKLPNGTVVSYKLEESIVDEFKKIKESSNLYSVLFNNLNLDKLSSYDKNIMLIILFLNKLFLHITDNMNFKRDYNNIPLLNYYNYLKSEYTMHIFDNTLIKKIHNENIIKQRINKKSGKSQHFSRFIYLYQYNLLLKLYELYPEFQNIKRYAQGYAFPLFLYKDALKGGGFLTNAKFLHLLNKNKLEETSSSLFSISNTMSLINFSSDKEKNFYNYLIKKELISMDYVKDTDIKRDLKAQIINFNHRLEEKTKYYKNVYNTPSEFKKGKTYNPEIYFNFIIEHNGDEKQYKYVNINNNICESIINMVFYVIKELFELNNSYTDIINDITYSNSSLNKLVSIYKEFFNIYHKIYTNTYFKNKNHIDNFNNHKNIKEQSQLIEFVSIYISLIEMIIINENKILQILYLTISKFILNNRLDELITKRTIELL